MIPGIANIGNTCCISTFFQCISACKSLSEEIINSKYHNPTGLIALIVQLLNILRTVDNGGIIDPKQLIEFLQSESKDLFKMHQQHDLSELYFWIIDYLHESAYLDIDKDKVKGMNNKILDEIVKVQNYKHSDILFNCQGIQVQMLECKKCKDHPYNIEPYITIDVNIPNSKTTINLSELIIENFKLETMDEWKCDKCNNIGGVKQLKLWSLPNALVFVIKRFDSNMNKINSPVNISEFINFAPKTLLSDPEKETKYRLVAIGNHYGSYNNGHYTATKIDKNNQWIECDDINVSNIENIHAELQNNRNAYMLFYELLDSNN